MFSDRIIYLKRAEKENHAWNVVYMEDHWIVVDSTNSSMWDGNGIGVSGYFYWTDIEVDIWSPVIESEKNISVGQRVKVEVYNGYDNENLIWKSYNPEVVEVDSKGVIRGLQCGKARITASSGIEEVTCEVTVTGKAIDISFTDVSPNAYYAVPVNWAVQNGITQGTSATTFSPNDYCTRGQIVTLLWRTEGSPEPSSVNNPFVDVKSDAYYYKAVLWAVERGITAGTTMTTFEPNRSCTRGQIVTFLYRQEN